MTKIDFKIDIFNPAHFLDMVGEDEDVLITVCTLFHNSYHEKTKAIKEAIKVGNEANAAKLVHSFRGELLIIGYPPSIDFASRMEDHLKKAEIQAAEGLFDDLIESLAPVVRYTKDHLN
ncbi:MAG: Hpt domain-containing protein [Oligoflexales bacterium]|nr:Hpt domain-containing protein [Oligoflexales bacterium]